MQAKQLEGHSLQALLVLAAIESRKDKKRGHQCFCLAEAPSLHRSHRDCCTAWANPATSLHRRVHPLPPSTPLHPPPPAPPQPPPPPPNPKPSLSKSRSGF